MSNVSTSLKLTKQQKELMKLAKAQGMPEAEILALIKNVKPVASEIKAEMPCVAKIGEYEGKPTISLLRGESSFVNRPFTFGKAKARMIVEQYDAIKAFATSAE